MKIPDVPFEERVWIRTYRIEEKFEKILTACNVGRVEDLGKMFVYETNK